MHLTVIFIIPASKNSDAIPANLDTYKVHDDNGNLVKSPAPQFKIELVQGAPFASPVRR